MPSNYVQHHYNSEEVHEIITSVPSWMLRWGITLILGILVGIAIFSALVQYPDVVKTSLKVNSINSPKAVLAKQNGKLSELLVKEGESVQQHQPLAYFESTANPVDVMYINGFLKNLKRKILTEDKTTVEIPSTLNLGEVQSSYQNLYAQYLQYLSTQKGGYYQNKMTYLQMDLENINKLSKPIRANQKLKEQEYMNQEAEYNSYQKLYKNKVISRSEFTQQENKFLSSKYPLQEGETNRINNIVNLNGKQKELLELLNTIGEERAKFLQAVNQFINESDSWIVQHILTAPISGSVSFAGIIENNQNFTTNQEIFIVNPANTAFYGEIEIPQYNMGKIRKGQRTLIKLKSYPFEEFGMIRGKLSFISDVAYRDSVFVAKVEFEHFENKNPLHKISLKNGMHAEAEIITEESTLLSRFFRNLTKMVASQ